MNEDDIFISAISANPSDKSLPLMYADWLDDRYDSRSQLLRVWVDLSWHASHASKWFCDLLAKYRRLWQASDPVWRDEFGSARKWIDAPLAEELCRGYLRYVENRPSAQRGVIDSSWFPDPTEPYTKGWLVSYWTGMWDKERHGNRIFEYQWLLYVQPELGWVYTIATCGPKAWLERFCVASGEGHAF